MERKRRQRELSAQALIEEVSLDALQAEIEKASDRFNIRAAWVAVIFVPVFAITDYLNIPHGWFQIFVIRCSISILMASMLLGRKRWQLTSAAIAIVGFIMISLQNAYTYTLVEEAHILQHSINYIALLIGAGMFLLWPWQYSVVMVVISTIATAGFISLNDAISVDYFLLHGGLLLAVVALFMIALIEFRYSLTAKELKAKLALQVSNEQLVRQKAITEEKNEAITDSIHYAKGIQTAILGGTRPLTQWFGEAFVLYEPKDILSGDFYWFHNDEQSGVKTIIAADCTGHGVPAALMTVMGNSLLDEIVIQKHITSPDEILKALDQRIIESLGRNATASQRMNDGMDMGILTISDDEVRFAGANNPLCRISGGELSVIKGSKFPIGSEQYAMEKLFQLHSFPRVKGDRLYLYTDGFQDQFGGPGGRKYLSRNFKQLLLQINALPMDQQRVVLHKDFRAWKGYIEQTDDILVIGITV
jgi:sigma-B regulation protein RsbU (phosphoserine phosphatase)